MPGSRRVYGFTLIEVIAALALLGTGLGILYLGYVEATHIEAKGSASATAYILARSKLEQIEAGEETASSGGFSHAAGYRWSLDTEPTGEEGLTKVSVSVSWDKHTISVWGLNGHEP